MVSFNENVHVVTYPYEAGSTHSSVTGDVSASRYIEAKQLKRRSRSVFRLLARVAAPLSQHDQSSLSGVVLPPNNCFTAPYDACCGLRVGENDAAYGEQSPLMRSARNSLDRRSIEGGTASVCSSRDHQDDIDPLVSYERARRTVEELTNQTAIVDERLRRGTITDDFDYDERRDSDEGDTLSLSDAHPSRDGIDEPEAIGDQLLSPPKERKSDERDSPAFDIVPLWQRLKRVDELDVAESSQASFIKEHAEARLTARVMQVATDKAADASAESSEIFLRNGDEDEGEDQEYVPTEPCGKRAKVAIPIEETEDFVTATEGKIDFSLRGNADMETDGYMEEEAVNVVYPLPCVIDQGSSSDPWSTADPASDIEAMLHARSSPTVAQSDHVGYKSTGKDAVGAVGEVSTRVEGEDEIACAVSDEVLVKVASVVTGEVVGDMVNKVMGEVEHVGNDDIAGEAAVNFVAETASDFGGENVNNFTGRSTAEEVLADPDVEANEIFTDAVAEVGKDMTGNTDETRGGAITLPIGNITDNTKGNETEPGNETGVAVDFAGKKACDIANKSTENSMEEFPDNVTDEPQCNLQRTIKRKVKDENGNRIFEEGSLSSGLPEVRVHRKNEAASICDRRVAEIHNERVSIGTTGRVVEGSVHNAHEATPTERGEDDRVSSIAQQHFVELETQVPSLDDRKVAEIYEEPCAAGNTSGENRGKMVRSADSLLQEACDLEEQLMAVVEDASMKLLREESSEVSICHGNEMSEATITETTGSASARLSARLRGEEPPRDAGLGLDLDPLCLSQDDYSVAACTPAMSPLAGVYYGDFSPPRQGEGYPERGAARVTGLADYPEYGMLKGQGMGESLFGSDPNTPIMQATSKCSKPFNELELGVEFGDENAPRRQVMFDDRRPKQAVPEVLLHDWSGSMPVEPSVEIVDSAPNSRSSATGLPSSSPRAIEPREDAHHAALMLSARLNIDMSRPKVHSSSGDGPPSSKRDSTKTETSETAGEVASSSSVTMSRAQNRNSTAREGSKTKGASRRHPGSIDPRASKKDFSFSSSLNRSGREKGSVNGRENGNEKSPASISSAKHGESTDPKLRDFQMAVERKSVSEMGYRTAGLHSQDMSFMGMDRSKEPASDFRTYAENLDKRGANQHRHRSQQRRRVSNMEVSVLAREDGVVNPFWNVMEKLVSRMQIGKKGVSSS